MEWFTANDETAADGAVFDDASSVLRDWVLARVCRDIFVAQKGGQQGSPARPASRASDCGSRSRVLYHLDDPQACGLWWHHVLVPNLVQSAAERWSRNALVS